MNLLKGFSVVVAVAGLAVMGAVASGSGHPAQAVVHSTEPPQVERADQPVSRGHSRELTILAGRGTEIG